MKTLIAILALLTTSAAADLADLLLERQKRVPSCVAILPPQEKLPRGTLKAWGQPRHFWPQRSTLRVRFMDGTTRQRNEAWKRLQAVDALVNLRFVQTSGAAEIRIAFKPGKGHWSYLGVTARRIPQTQQTMNLDLKAGIFGDLAAEWDRVAIHEALHAIGLEHEHQHPLAGIAWNREAVYSYYQQTQGWSREEIDYQVLNRYSGTSWRGTAYDPSSIMQYPVPPGLANIVIGWNDALSPSDIAFLKTIYP